MSDPDGALVRLWLTMRTLQPEERGLMMDILMVEACRGQPASGDDRALANLFSISLRKWKRLSCCLVEREMIAIEGGNLRIRIESPFEESNGKKGARFEVAT